MKTRIAFAFSILAISFVVGLFGSAHAADNSTTYCATQPHSTSNPHYDNVGKGVKTAADLDVQTRTYFDANGGAHTDPECLLMVKDGGVNINRNEVATHVVVRDGVVMLVH